GRESGSRRSPGSLRQTSANRRPIRTVRANSAAADAVASALVADLGVHLGTFLGDYLGAPAGATDAERHNFRVAYRESALIGVMSAGGTFLPVFLARLGATNLQVSLLVALPSLMGVILAIPLGGLIQTRRNIIP